MESDKRMKPAVLRISAQKHRAKRVEKTELPDFGARLVALPEPDHLAKLKILEAENARLQRLLAEMMRERRALPTVETPSLDFCEALMTLWRWSNRGCARVAKLAGIEIEVATLNIIEALAPIGPIRIVDLAGRLQLDRSTVSRQVAAAIASGHIERVASGERPREPLLTVSEHGRWVLAQMVDAWGQIGLRFMADWSHADQLRMAELLERLEQRVSKDMAA